VIEEEQEQELVPCRRARTSPSAKQRGSELGGGWESWRRYFFTVVRERRGRRK
jgi:hypothetical protein